MSGTATSSTSTDGPTQVASASCPAEQREPSLLGKEWKKLLLGLVVFGLLFALPLGWQRFDQSIYEALALTKWYAQEHVLLCLVPAFFIAGAIAVFISQNAVMKYLGPTAPKPLAYGVASVSGTILAVCSCTVLPLFAGIWRMGAGLGPATAFLYSGPTINLLAIVLTAAAGARFDSTKPLRSKYLQYRHSDQAVRSNCAKPESHVLLAGVQLLTQTPGGATRVEVTWEI